MSNIFCKAIFYSKLKIRALPCSLNEKHLLSVRLLSTTSKDYSFTVSYLINSCGLSPESGLKASKYVKFENPIKPNKVIQCLKSQGFSNTQISDAVKRQPAILVMDPERSIMPKIEFFMSKGVSQCEVAKLFSLYPAILRSRLEERIVPAFSFLEGITGCEGAVLSSLNRYLGILTCNLEGSLVANVDILRECGVPELNIGMMLKSRPRVMAGSAAVLGVTVKEVKAMGFNPERKNFLEAVAVLRQISKTTWERKVEAYKKWGWSEESVYHAFRSSPWCMAASEDKITAVMDFIVNTMGCDSSAVIKYPKVVNMSLEKRIIPRGCVIKVLMSKGLIKNKCNLRNYYDSERVFVEKFITAFEKQVPEIIKVYKGNMGLSKT